MRKSRRNVNRRNIGYALGMAFCFCSLLIVGYAAFATNLSLNAKGNILVSKKLSLYINELYTGGDITLFDDGTTDHNIRYTGLPVNNYVSLDSSETICSDANLYRIIGVFNNIKTLPTGTNETRVKLIKAYNNGDAAFDFSGSSNWARPATLNEALQSLPIAFSKLIDNAVWNLAGDSTAYQTSIQQYAIERGTGTSGEAPLTWTGKVALMLGSDYGYASSACKESTSLYDYDSATCKNSNWLYINKNDNTHVKEWTQAIDSAYTNLIYRIDENGKWHNHNVTNELGVRPVIFLKADVVIKNNGRTGSLNSPYQLDIN